MGWESTKHEWESNLRFRIFAFFCGTAPMVSTCLIKTTGVLIAPAVYLIFLALVILPAYMLLKPAKKLDQQP